MKLRKVAILGVTPLLVSSVLFGCSSGQSENSDDGIYTFYRNSTLNPSMRLHVATFDSNEGGVTNTDYNRASCEEAASLYRENDSSRKNWWCEKGRYRP